jgi:hypothetical protein
MYEYTYVQYIPTTNSPFPIRDTRGIVAITYIFTFMYINIYTYVSISTCT